MANSKAKYDEIHELVASAFDEVTGDKNEWMKFLKSSCRNYKCDFNEKLLIYSQKPHATAVLTYDEWNENFGRQVKRGAWGIAVIDNAETSSKYAYKYLFDISDTYEKKNSIPVPIWERQETDNQSLIEHLKSEYSENIKENGTLQEAIREAIDLQIKLEYDITPTLERQDILLKNIAHSIEVSVFERLSIEVPQYDFQGMELLWQNEIEELTSVHNEISSNMILEMSKVIQLNKHKEKSNERNNIQRSERNNDTQSNEQQQSGIQHREVRSDEESVHGREQKSIFAKRDEERNITEISALNQSGSDSDDRNVDIANESEREDNGRDEGSRKSSMDESDEQHKSESGRNSAGGSSLSLDQSEQIEHEEDSSDIYIPLNTLPLEVKQLSFLEAVGFEEVKDIYELFSNSELDIILQRGSVTEGGKLRIKEAFATLGSKQELVDFVKKEYDYCGFSPMSVGKKREVGINASPKGLELYCYDNNGVKIKGDMYSSGERISEIKPWNKITTRIKHLIDCDKYLDDKELQKYIGQYVFKEPTNVVTEDVEQVSEPVSHKKYDINDIEPVSKICPNDILAGILSFNSGFEGAQERIYTYFQRGLDDKSNIEFLIQEYGDSVIVYDVDSSVDVDEDEELGPDDYSYRESFNAEGYTISKETAGGKFEVELIEWGKLYEFIQHLIKADMYVNKSNLEAHEDIDNEIDSYIKSFGWDVEIPQIDKEKLNVQEIYTRDYNDYIGETFAYEGRQYIFDSIDKYNASLKDITFQEGTGFPIWRSEPIGWAVEKIEKARAIKKQQELANAKNYEIKDNEVGVGTPRERYKNNINAIKIVQTCESENRTATAEEQEILSKYVGWGGLSEAFDESKWGNEYEELKELLSDEQYNSARASTLTSFYTPPIVIKAMYQALSNMGLEKGNILEPSCGVGNFIGCTPKTLGKANFYGVEIDDISGKIAKLLYPQSKIQVTGFEKASLSDNFFDSAIGNVPFGDFKIVDSKYDKQNFQIHDYFFAKALDKVRPSGVVAFITSQGTLDKTSEKFRSYINERAEFLGAIRLPDNTFKSAAGTRVTSDIIFLQKRERQNLADADWIHLDVDQNDIEINSYYAQNPHMIMGTMRMETGPYGMQANCKPIEGASLEKRLEKAIEYIKGEIKPVIAVEGEDVVETIPADPSVRNHSYTIINGEVFFSPK